MAEIVKLLSAEMSLTTASTVSSASVVRIYNAGGAASLLTLAESGVPRATTTIAAGGVIYIAKPSTFTIQSATAVLATAVAFTN